MDLSVPDKREAADSELRSPEHLRSARSQRAKRTRITRITRIICDGRRAVSHLLIPVSILANDSRVEWDVVYVKPIQNIPLIFNIKFANGTITKHGD